MKCAFRIAFFIVIVILTMSELPVYGATVDFLPDDTVERFVNLMHETESDMCQKVKEALTGKSKATDEQLELIYDTALDFYGLIDQQELLVELTKGTAAEKLPTYNAKISFAVKLVSGAIEICDNAKSFSKSESCMQKTVDALQIGYRLLTNLNLDTYIPSSISLALSSVEVGLAVGGILELSYLEENYTLYEYELQIAYHTDEELPYRTAPTLALGSTITQEEADAKYAILYMQFRMKQILRGFPGYENGDSAEEDSYTIIFNSNCSEIQSITQTFQFEETVIFPEIKRPGYIFEGWYTENSCQNRVEEVEKTDQTFYAKWSALYTFIILEGKVTITGYNTEPAGRLELPSSINGYPVTVLGEKAFYDCDLITSVVIPDTVTDIKKNAFWQNDLLESIGFGNSIKNIEYGAFYNCNLIKSVVLPDSVVSIGASAFNHCDSVEKLVLGKNIKSIGEQAFAYCISLQSVEFKGSLEKISYHMFAECSSLVSITIPDGVTTIEGSAFSNCSNLAEAIIPESVTVIGGHAFQGCKSLKAITIPASVTTLYQQTFANCSSLESVEIHKGIEKIDLYVFRNCASLKEINVDEENPNYISVDGVLFDKDRTKLIVYPAGKTQTNYEIPEGVTYIEKYAFYMCTQLKELTIPSSINYISYDAFMDCRSLERVNIENLTSWNNVVIENINACPTNYAKEVYLSGMLATDITIPDNVTKVGKYTFCRWKTLKKVTIPSSVTEIGEGAFRACTSIEKVLLTEGLTNIGSSAFYSCTALLDISIPESVQNIGSSAFAYCNSLKSMTIGGVKKIDAVAPNCRSLETIVIGNGVERIGAYSFSGSLALKQIWLPESLITIEYGAFEGNNDLTDIYYEGSYADWNNIVIEEDGNSVICNANIHYNKLLIEHISAEFSNADTIKCKLELSPYDNKSVTIYAAIYDDTGKLEVVNVQKPTLNLIDSTSVDIAIKSEDILENYTFAVFVWTEKMVPCTTAQKYLVKSINSILEQVKKE